MSTSSAVKAWKYTTPSFPENLHLSNHNAPSVPPNDTSIVVRMRAVALNPVDVQLMNFPLFYMPFYRAPKIPGADFAGTVIAAGPASGFSKGDEVLGLQHSLGGHGTLAEVQSIDTKLATVIKKPGAWTFAQAAAVPLVWLTARTSIERVAPWVEGIGTGAYTTAAQRKKLVVLGGSSATGMYTVHLAKARGWEVLASCSGRNVDFVKSMGAAHAVDYTAEDVRARVRSFAPAAIVDCVGGTDTLGIAPRYVTIVGDKTSRGSMGGPLTYYWTLAPNLRWLKGRMGWGEVYDIIMLEGKNEWLREVTELTPDQIFIDSEVGFEDVKNGYDRLNTGRTRGKVVVTI